MSARPALAWVLLLLAASVVQAQTAVTVTGYSVSPEVFMPGDTGVIRATIKNTGTAASVLNQVTFYAPQFETLIGSYPNVGTLGAGESTTFAFNVRAPASAGTYSTEIQFQASGQSVRFPILLQVDSSGVEVLATSVPSLISLGGSDVTLVVANLRPNAVRSVRVAPEAQGITFAPRERYLDLLNSGNSTSLSFTATATEGGSRGIAFQVTFNNGDNVHRSTAKTVTVAAEVSPTLELSLDDSTRIAPGGSGALVFRLKNNGAGTLDSIGLSWADSTGKIVPVGTTRARYAGSLAAGGETTVTFPVASAPGTTVGVYLLNVTLQYTDTSNLQRAVTQSMGVFVGGGTDIEVALQEVSGTTVSLLVANVGTSTASSVVVRVPRQAGFPLSGADSAALGNLNPGDFTFATFRVGGAGAGAGRNASGAMGGEGEGHAPGASPSPQGGGGGFARGGGGGFARGGGSAQVEVDYTDATGARRSLQKELAIDLSQPFRQNLAGESPSRGGGGFPLLPVVAVAAVGAVLYWKRAPITARLKRKKPEL